MVCPGKGNQHCIQVVRKCPVPCLLLRPPVLQACPVLCLPPNCPTIHTVFNGFKRSIPHPQCFKHMVSVIQGPRSPLYRKTPDCVYIRRSWYTHWWCDCSLEGVVESGRRESPICTEEQFWKGLINLYNSEKEWNRLLALSQITVWFWELCNLSVLWCLHVHGDPPPGNFYEESITKQWWIIIKETAVRPDCPIPSQLSFPERISVTLMVLNSSALPALSHHLVFWGHLIHTFTTYIFTTLYVSTEEQIIRNTVWPHPWDLPSQKANQRNWVSKEQLSTRKETQFNLKP